jgi:outer membrane protein insertion porin family
VRAYLALFGLLLGLGASSAVAADQTSSAKTQQLPLHKLARVEILGATAFTQTQLESNLDIGPGDLIDRGRIARTAENLSTLYRNHGYELIKISTRIYQAKAPEGGVDWVLEYKLNEGKPTRVAGVVLTPSQLRDEVAIKFWNRLKPELEAKIGLAPGDLYDQEKIANARRVLEEALTSNEFIGAKVTDITVVEGVEPQDLKIGKYEAKAWIKLEFHIDLGDRVTFGFRGNENVSQGRLSALIDEQRVVGFGKDYVESIRTHIQDEYRSLGYAHASVTPYIFERPADHERHLTYVIDEGVRVKIEKIQFDGNVIFTQKELQEQLYAKASDVVNHGYYVEKDVQKAGELLLDWIKSQGYLSAKLLTISHDYPPKPLKTETGKYVDLSIYLYEGEQTTVRSIHYAGGKALRTSEIDGILGISEGQPLNLFTFSEGIETLKARYRQRGYLSVQVQNEGTDKVVTYANENRSADIFLDINEGPQFIVTGIQIEGLTQTKDFVVRREFLFRKGAVLEESQLIGTEARLHRLGIFAGVNVRALSDPDDASGKIVRVSIQEGTPGVVGGGAGLRNDLGPRLFAQSGYTNLWGEDQTISLNAAINRRLQNFRFLEYETQLAYIWPYFAWGETTFRPTITLSGTEYFNFDAVTAALTLTWERTLAPRLVGNFSYSLERIVQFDGTTNGVPDPTLNGGYIIGAVTPTLRYDHRDNALAPTSGYFLSLSYELAEPWLGARQQSPSYPIGYYRAIFRGDYFWPVTSDVNWYFSFRSGYEQSLEPTINPSNPNDTTGSIPVIKQFALGGIGSLRGLQEQSFNLSQFNIRGSASYVNYRTQIDLPFAGSLKFGPFLDAANLNLDTYSLWSNMVYCPGFSFRYLTPVGPVNLDFGFPINPPPGSDTQEFFFSIGII